MKTRRVTTILTGLVLLCVLTAIASSAELKKITTIEGITEYRLDNGLQVLLFPDPSKPRVTVSITVFVGSRHEGYGEAGMAHLLEHMLFKGTPTHSDIPKLLKDRGAVYNGSTWYDRTNYFETLPASDDNLEFAIRLEADRLVNSYVKAKDLASEMTVVRNEFERGENSPSSVLWERMMSAAYDWHNYGKSTIGNRADIERVPIAKLQAFYHRYYQPDNAMLVIAGQFHEAKALELVKQTFGRLPRPKRTLDKTYTEEPAQDGERRVTLRRVGDVAVVGAVYHIPSGAHPDYASIDVLETILTAAPAGRLYKALVETKMAASVSGAAFGLHDPGAFLLMAEVASGKKPQAVLETFLDVTEKVGTTGVTAKEVERAKQRLLKQRELAAANTSRLAVELSDWAAQGDWRLYFLYRDRLEKVSPQSVQQVAARYLRRNNRTVGVYLPIKSPERVAIPPTPDLAEMIGDYKGRKAETAGEAFDVSPANIEARTKRFNLASGLKVVLLPKKTRGESVNLRLTLRYGDEKNLAGLAKATEFLPLLMLRGTRKLTRQQIQDALDQHRTRLNATGTPGVATFTIQTKRPHLAAALDLLRQVLREPTFPKTELDILREGELATLEKRLTDPMALAQVAVSRKINPYPKGDPRYVPTAAEELDMTRAVDVDAIRRLYESFLNGQWGELAVVGDFDDTEVRQQFTEILGGWTASKPYRRIPKRGDIPLESETLVIQTPGKANATYFAGTVFPMRDDDLEYPALLLGNYILGGGSLSSRLGNRVRQKEGLSYSIRSGLHAASLDERTAFYVFAICNPANMKHLEATIREVIDQLVQKGVTAEELQAAKQGYLQRLQVTRSDDASLARILANQAQADRTMAFQAERERQLETVMLEAVSAAVRKYVDLNRLVIATAGDLQPADSSQPSP